MSPIFINNFLPNQIFNLVNSYCIIKYSNLKTFKIDDQSNSLIGQYGDPLMETLLDMSTPVIEKNVGKNLFPTYSYFRIYDKLSDLKVHTDRDSCEYTVALCVQIENKFKMLPNDALIFQGTDKYHWREECIHDHYMTVFLHYVDQNGEYSELKFDGRTMLGQLKTK